VERELFKEEKQKWVRCTVEDILKEND
jgi:hypothetical protein